MKHFIKKLVLVTFIICMFIPFASLAEKGVMYLTSPDNFQVMSLSPNGKWACGILGDGYSINQGLLWNLETSEITYLSTTDESTAYAVTDEGVVCGGYTDYTLHPAGLGVYVAGIYKDGEWHRLDNSGFEDEGVLMYDSEAYAISADGRTIVGSVQIESSDSKLAPARWVDGKLDAILPYEKAGVCYAITRDGSKAAGWAYQPDDDGDMNRSIAVWEGDGIQYLSPKPTTFEAGRFFSADGSKLVCESFGHKFIYDLTTQEKTELPWVHPKCWSQNVYYVNNDGIVLGGEEFQDDATGASGFYGYVYDAKADKAYKFDQWMKDTYGVEIDSTYFKTQYAVAMSDDAKTFAILSYRVPTDAWVSKIIKLDQEVPNFMEIGDKFTVDGIHYEVLNESGQVAVTYYGDKHNSIPDEYKYAGEVVIPETVSYQGAMYSVTSIGDHAFYDCSGLTEITIPNSVTSIGDYAFGSCDGLTSITIPNSVTSIDDTAFSHCDGLTSINIEEGNRVYDSREDCNAIIETATNTLVAGCKNTIIPNNVTSIGARAFWGCDGLTSITIPESVTFIDIQAFEGCSGLTEVIIHKGVTSISGLAFSWCSNLTSITIPESVTSIGQSAFHGCCDGLTSIKVVEGNTVYDSRENCNAIIETATNTLIQGCVNTVIPNSVTSIGEEAFFSCDSLTSITIPESVTSIGEGAFYGCSGLTSITIPNSVTSIGEDAFHTCSGLTSITIPNSVTSIGNSAFSWCWGLTSITIPNSVTSIGVYAFGECTGLTSIKVEDGNTVYDSREGCNAIIETATNTLVAGCKNAVIPNSVTSIGDYAFSFCTGLTAITITNSITSIGENAFSDCYGLTEITIPESVASMGARAFHNCHKLKQIRIEAFNPPTIESSTFEDVDKFIPVYVPAESLEAYQSAEYWSEFTNIVAYTELEAGDKFTVDGIHYEVLKESGQVAVTYYGEGINNIPDEYKYAGTVVIPESVTYEGVTYSVTSIGYYAFLYCHGLTEITIPESVTSIGDAAYSGCTGLTSIKVEEGNIVYDSREGCNAIIETATNTLVVGCKNTVIPNSVTSIGDYAFGACDGLTEITIPESVTSIGDNAFSSCSGLTSVTIPESVTSIGYCAFSYCYGLTEITIPNSVTSIGDYAFNDCSGLISIVVEEDNTVYDSREDCNAIIETVTNTLVAGCKKTIIPNSVTSIGSKAFQNCNGLTEITIPNSVASIGDYAFSYCYGLTSITIPESVTSIGQSAFWGCSGLTSITIPESVTSIGQGAFWGCSGLTSIRIEVVNPPAIEESTFNVVDKTIPVYVPTQECVEAYRNAEYWSEFTNIVAYTELEAGDKFTVDGIHYEVLNESGQVAVTYYGEDAWNVPEEYKYAGEVVIPETVSYQGATYSVTLIGQSAFYYCHGLTEITIPNSVTSIGYCAFRGCDGLTEITIPESVTSIGDYAFEDCDGLTSVTIPNSVASIGDCAFRGCDGLTSIVVEEGNTVYDSREGCNAIIETATNTLVAGCKKTIIPNSVTSIGDYAFIDCYGLTEIIIPSSVTSIGDYAFCDCSGLTSITIPSSVTSIGDYAFSSCSGLTSITIPSSVTSIGDYAFSYCNGLTSMVVEDGNIVYDSREGCNAIIETATNTLVAGCKNTVIPNSVTSIGYSAFSCCFGLTSITIPNSVTSIGQSAFYNCTGLTEITIPNSITSIGDYAFSYCTGLTSIRIEAVNPPAIEDNTFDSVDKSIPVYVPTQECVEAYRNAEYWSEFTNIQSYTETLTYDVVVPAGTWECYIIGEFNQMSEFVPMTKINDIHYTITIEGVERSMHYQYACGNGREYVEAGDVRTYNEKDVVEGWTNMPAVEAGEPEANCLQSGGVTVSRLYDVLSTARVPMVVELINEAAISALQCDIYLPEGLSVATVENGLDVAMGNRGSHDHTIDARTLDNGAIRVLVMSGTAAPLTGNAGALFTIGVIPNENYTEDAQIVICNIVMTDTDIVEYNPKQIFADCHIKESVLGDANSDGRVNVTDIVLLAKYILGGYNGNIDVLAADINQDSRINVSDIVALANLILSGKGAAGAPARQEGVQGTLSMDHVLLNTNAPTIAPMMLDNTVAYTAFQMDVIVPEGLCIEDVVCGERLTAAHNLMWKEQADGSVRIIAFATDNTPIKESQGELFHLVLSAEDGFADGEIYVSDAIFVTRGMLTHQVNDIVAGVSAPTGIEAMYSNNRVYAAHRTIVIETTCEQPAYITTIDGVSQSIDLQPGRNVLQVSQQGVYIVTVGNENKKVVVK